MTDKKVWLITGAGRGLGLDIAKAALAAGHAVIATGRDPAKVAAAIGHQNKLLTIKLDVTRLQDAQAAAAAAVAQFGRIDVLVNNAGNFYAGFFEELGPEQVRNQIETLLFGPMNVTRAALPVMRKQRAGLLIAISSTAGISGQLFCTAYAAAKFGVEGWMESLAPEIAPFGIRTMLVEPGFFRTELLSNESTTYAKPAIEDYAKKTQEIVTAWSSMDGKQGATPASSPARSCVSPGWKSLRPASRPVLMPFRPSRPRPIRCLLRRTRIAGCPHLLLTTAHDSRAHRTPGNGLRHRPVV